MDPADGPRLPLVLPGVLTERQREVYDRVAGGRRANGPFAVTDDDGALTGPFNALLFAPEIGGALGRLGEAIRYGGSLSDRVREIAILTVAAHHRSDFEWYAHERVGEQVGLSEVEMQRIRRGEPLEHPSEREAAAVAFCRAVVRDRDVDTAVHDRAVTLLGHSAVVEIVVLVGYYQALALLLSVFHVGSPEPVTWPTSADG
jgi:4-carboxymuconolactone decarboxylase